MKDLILFKDILESCTVSVVRIAEDVVKNGYYYLGVLPDHFEYWDAVKQKVPNWEKLALKVDPMVLVTSNYSCPEFTSPELLLQWLLMLKGHTPEMARLIYKIHESEFKKLKGDGMFLYAVRAPFFSKPGRDDFHARP